MGDNTVLGDVMETIIKEMKEDVGQLSEATYYDRWKLLDHLQDRVSMLENYWHIVSSTVEMPFQDRQDEWAVLTPVQTQQTDIQRSFTIEELATYDGKNGNPAYVAVNHLVYDMSDIPVWGAATHFGLKAGKDLSKNFATCHAGSNILQKLTVVGSLQD